MKTRLVSLLYRGSASVDPRYSAAMLPWTINDIRSIESYTKLSVGIENGILESYNSDFELQFSHPLKYIVGMCRIVQKQNGKSVGSAFLQIKQPSLSSGTTSNNNSSGSSYKPTALTSSVSHGSLSSSSSSSISLSALSQGQTDGMITIGPFTGNNSNQTSRSTAPNINNNNSTNSNNNSNNNDSNKNHNNLMEFTGPFSGLVYLMKDPKDPLLHIYLFECEAVDEMSQLMQQMRDPAHTLGGSVGSIPQTLVSHSDSGNEVSLTKALAGNGVQVTPATNLKLAEAARIAQQEGGGGGPTNLISAKMKSSKSYTHGLSNSAGTVHIPTSTSAQSNLSLLADISPNHTHFFEVMYVGKIRVSHKRVPFSFIDDALPKFKAYDAQRQRLQMQMASSANRKMSPNTEKSVSSIDVRATSFKENEVAEEEEEEEKQNDKEEFEGIIEDNRQGGNEAESAAESNSSLASVPVEENKENKSPKRLIRGVSHIEMPSKKEIPKQRDRSASYGCIPPFVEQNRTMVFLVSRSDLRLISPDRKQVLLYKDFKDVASCAQGQKHADHFGIICREAHTDGYIGYVFKCQSDHVCDDIVAAISQAFVTCAEQKRREATQIFSCEHCPMLWYHKLCTDVEGLSEKKTQAMIFRRIESLSDDEQDTIWAKFYGSEKINSPLADQNQFLMMLLRAHCESRQQRHVHDTAENRSEFLNQYLGGSTIFMKAKRSLTNSFDHLLKRKASKDDIVLAQNSRDRDHEHQTRETSAEPNAIIGNRIDNETPPEGFRSRSNTIGGSSPSKPTADQLKSPMMDIFIKVGNSPKESETHQGSWRQAILNSVVTPSKGIDGTDAKGEFYSPMRINQPRHGKRTSEELCDLWKTAIRQTILLNRMEKENAMLQARQNENELKRIKLDYDEIVPCDKQLIERWEMIIERDSVKIGNKKDPKVLSHAIKNGVPRSKRGDVWTFLAEQHSMNMAPVDTKKFPNFGTPYHTLLKSLTEHQHAIFIDLGRTFPNHKFYKDPLGVGQLSLFNLLKAYSILDPELGYCQGLGFICGILLLHCDEANAFQLLKHLMFCRQMRTKYLPDMKKFQLQLYQLSRLVKDQLPDLYNWLDHNDVSPTLYAAPWILTVFSSQFPLGFVARVFDLLFLESSEVIFKFAIALLTVHSDELLARDNFEEIMDYLKTVVPRIDAKTMERIMKMIFMMDISKQLNEYKVEYNVLQEEISTTNHHLDMLSREKAQNQHLEQQLQFAQSSIAQLEKTRSSQKLQISSLQTQVQTMELTIQTLGRFVAQIAERQADFEFPSDVRRIIQQLDDIEKQRRKPLFSERKIGKSVSVNSHLGFPLKVLEELSERDEHGSPQKQKKGKTPFFEHTYEQIRQQRTHGFSLSFSNTNNSHSALTNTSTATTITSATDATEKSTTASEQPLRRPNRLLNDVSIYSATNISEDQRQSQIEELKLSDHVEKVVSNIKSPNEVDSGVGTPLSPPSTSSILSCTSNNSIGSSNGFNVLGSNNSNLFSRVGYKNTSSSLSPLSKTKSTLTQSASSKPIAITEPQIKITCVDAVSKEEMHPLSVVGGDVNVRFNGTTQLKSIRPIHHVRPQTQPDKRIAENNTDDDARIDIIDNDDNVSKSVAASRS